MPPERMRLAVIIGSVRQNRFGLTVGKWFASEARQFGEFDVDVIDVADVKLPMRMPDFGQEPGPEEAAVLAEVTPRLAEADAFVVVTPEYNHSFPAALKNLIDWRYMEWRAKPVGFVSYGGIAGGLRAVEQLRLVFAELHAVTVRDTVSFHGGANLFESDGVPKDPEGCGTAAKVMLNHLLWWASALREARAKHPYRS
ncbi:FMN reductase [Longimycelium tulufanense]|uniref:FMN reductase n=1 Tax=Longimycelium tulufanense TaxID=907463 RepID=A0A8J3FWX5_9PSEU|nr:NAD(P)H-dependent oxidoreductase [Longimycelium tulufanense]GGM70088.1 FMN reductase [Longimycelium tulufanense]